MLSKHMIYGLPRLCNGTRTSPRQPAKGGVQSRMHCLITMLPMADRHAGPHNLAVMQSETGKRYGSDYLLGRPLRWWRSITLCASDLTSCRTFLL